MRSAASNIFSSSRRRPRARAARSCSSPSTSSTIRGFKQAIIVVPEKSIGASFNDEPLTKFGFWADWTR